MATWKGRLRTAGLAAGVCVLVLAALAAGYAARGLVGGGGAPHDHAAAPAAPPKSGAPQIYTCPMHPEIRQPAPGRCPKCGMVLVPVKTGEEAASLGPRTLVLTPEARALLEVETRPAERRFVAAEVRLVGHVDYDETRLRRITAWVAGRIDRLYVDYTGIHVNAGEHMVELYSPDLVAAQEELLQALKAVRETEASNVEIMRTTARATVTAARERLRLWGLKKEQIEAIEKRGTAEDHLTIYAPLGGTVVEKAAFEGAYVQPGSPIYTIADLTRLWVQLDAYESDLQWIRYGQEVTFTTEAFPGETFTGRIAFLSPVLDARTRTVKVRVNLPDPEGKLKPEMFVRGIVRSRVAASGKVMDPALAGKWICSMHPEVVRDAPGACDLCGMPLVTTESLGYVAAAETDADRPLVIPASAALVTGTRAIVYVEVPGAEKPTYEGREVLLGPRAGDYYLVRGGLAEGEQVVTHGNFLIDSALQLEARPSMMNPAGGGAAPAHEHGGAAPKAPASAKPDEAGPASAKPDEAGPATAKPGEAGPPPAHAH